MTRGASRATCVTASGAISRRPFWLGVLACLGAACGKELDVGSNVLWTAQHETGDFSEWTAMAPPDIGGAVSPAPATANLSVSNALAHAGASSVKFVLSTTVPQDQQQTLSLKRTGVFPEQAYYSAWYYLPSRINVGTFWVIMKFRRRDNPVDAATPASQHELYDLNLKNLDPAVGDGMTLRLFDYDTRTDDPLSVATPPIVPIGKWFQIEAFYSNKPAKEGRFTLWLDGRQVIDLPERGSPVTSWVDWEVSSIGNNLSQPSGAAQPVATTAVLYADDAAVSVTRVGPAGRLRP